MTAAASANARALTSSAGRKRVAMRLMATPRSTPRMMARSGKGRRSVTTILNGTSSSGPDGDVATKSRVWNTPAS
jgi:hypothetical protein